MLASCVIPAWDDTRITDERGLGLGSRATGRSLGNLGTCAGDPGLCAVSRGWQRDRSFAADAVLLFRPCRAARDCGVGRGDGSGLDLRRGVVGPFAQYGAVA